MKKLFIAAAFIVVTPLVLGSAVKASELKVDETSQKSVIRLCRDSVNAFYDAAEAFQRDNPSYKGVRDLKGKRKAAMARCDDAAEGVLGVIQDRKEAFPKKNEELQARGLNTKALRDFFESYQARP